MTRILLVMILLLKGGFVLQAQSVGDSVLDASNKKIPVKQVGVASYYHSKFQGRKTASGEQYDEKKMTAAHNRVPIGTWIKVVNLMNKRSVIVRVNDRMHRKNHRLVDLSRAAASKLGYIGRGLTKVSVEILPKGPEKNSSIKE